MSEPWHSLPKPLADDVAGCWKSVFPEGVPAWLTSAEGMDDAVVATAISRSLFLRQTLERHAGQIQALVVSRSLAEPTTLTICKIVGRIISPRSTANRSCIRPSGSSAWSPSSELSGGI